MLIGATIVSFATTAPEFAVSATAAYLGHTDVTIGNAVGSVICNTGFVLGSIITVKAIPVKDDTFPIKSGLMLLSGIVLIIVSRDGNVNHLDGIILLLVFFAFLFHASKTQRVLFEDDEPGREKIKIKDIRKDIAFFVLGSFSVVIGSRILVDSGIKIAEWIGIPEVIIALTAVAIGTSLPELATAIASLRKGHQDLSIGNILGANTMDVAMVLGVSSQIRVLPVSEQLAKYDFPFMFFITLALVVFGITGKKLERWEGGAILGAYLFYVAGLFILYG
ncbi:Inner membrane protein YrbG, predicted calcium/sodium:proton antiporter [Methanosarcina siciliae T4/M]|uniref:Inner membrane protein YrbG, predicted calcium/sodium:proton antiporter n=3 Tax=Methanosarcina siciliae TaxID=38027 RepID=A0A0E3PC41_9EURY|nr:Inner membrane protein YrbG, predicted calcium/sodium:proton antiporter [Methanosarcina siciliae T4/M]AKB31837.1 Inner membrane protein YrbG, predicted calcium/sodium:proton antiporter [Methanosarcina siciliae HI350]